MAIIKEYRLNSRNMFLGEVLRKGITVTRSSGSLAISSAKVTVYDASDDSVVTAEASATIDGGNVYAIISAGSTIRSLYAIFKFVDGSYTGKARLDFNVVQG